MFGKWFKGKQSETSEQNKLPSPLNLRLGAAVTLDTVVMTMLSDKLNFEVPSSQQIIEAQGAISLGMGSYINRYYTSEDGFIQVNTTGGHEEQHIDDVKFFVFAKTLYPGTDAEWNTWLAEGGQIGQPTLNFLDTQYQRGLNAETPGAIRPIEFTEIVHSRSGEPPYQVVHRAMFYERPLSGSERYEGLLVSAEHNADGDCLVFSLGVDLDPMSLSVI
ncbi:DUF2491 family protein [Endozoicomonas sp. SM1973]|uniref:DUF2491 family protein n=1 Tax=Spartinivicinus marinus TaxID=2994442 RepID=A0A853I965_9GAMM|nr:DUF2491 family protein [Spartinivicinus marinus]MCX4025802.1 DUF2491 family protein [Spartinivicinus marinus]NYZ65795.1 DUF2491 family protein [Spartinivicinus marinus]